MPVPMGIRVFSPSATRWCRGRPGVGRPGPFLWIPAKNCGNDKVGVGGNGQSGQTKNQQTSLPVKNQQTSFPVGVGWAVRQ